MTSDMSSIEISVVMPCLNEADTIADCIADAQYFFQRAGVQGEIVIGDNGSTDGSIEIAKKLGARIVDIDIKGYGAACRGAAAAAYGQFVIMGDSDRSYNFAELDQFVDQLRAGADLVMGNRFKGGIAPGAMPFKNRYLGNPVLSFIGKLLFSTKVGDFHCGLRGFKKDAFLKMNLVSTGMEYASEMVMKATLLKMDVREVPTTLSQDGRNRTPHLRPWRDGWRHLKLMLLYSPRYLFLIPGILLVIVGLLAIGLVANNLAKIGDVTFGPATMVYGSAIVIIGLQAILFSAMAKIYGIKAGFLPDDQKVTRFSSIFTMERLLLVGILILVVSLVVTVGSIRYWASAEFGPLVPQTILSFAIPSSLGIVISLDIILYALFSGLLEIENTTGN